MRLIDANYVDASLEFYAAAHSPVEGKKEKIIYDTLQSCRIILGNAPTIDATPIVHGKWISMGNCRCDCSICGGTVLGRTDRTGWADSAFCGYCGAKMDGKPRNADTCVCCGDTIPEGRQTCPNCEAGAGIYSGEGAE